MEGFCLTHLCRPVVIQSHRRVFVHEPPFRVIPQHRNWIQGRSFTGPLQSLHFVIPQPFRSTCWCILDNCPAAEPKFVSARGHKQMAGHSPPGFLSFVTSWMSCYRALGVFLVGLVTPWKVHGCSMFWL